MQAGPHFREDLTIVVEAPDGDFVAFGGLWFDPVNKIAYVEPVATVLTTGAKGLVLLRYWKVFGVVVSSERQGPM